MIAELQIVREVGQHLVEVVNDARAGLTVYSLAKKPFDTLKGYFGAK